MDIIFKVFIEEEQCLFVFFVRKKRASALFLLDNDANTKTCMNQKCNEYKRKTM